METDYSLNDLIILMTGLRWPFKVDNLSQYVEGDLEENELPNMDGHHLGEDYVFVFLTLGNQFYYIGEDDIELIQNIYETAERW